MAYPTDLETLATDRSNTTDVVDTHPADHNNENRLINALQAKVGADSSAVTTSHDYKLGEVTGSDKAVGKTASQTLTNKTLTAPVISTISNTGTITLPTSTDTLVGRDTSDTLTNKTLTTPTIGSFTNATHTHQDNAGGGQLNATSVFSAGTVPTARLGSGTANNTTFLRGDQTWAATAATFNYGGGSDGAVNLDGSNTFSFLSKSGNVYTMTRDMYATTLTIGSGVTLVTAGWIWHASVEVTGTGTIKFVETVNPGANGSGTSGGAGGAATTGGWFQNTAGGDGGNGSIGSGTAGTNGAAQTSTPGVAGSAGGHAANGSVGGQFGGAGGSGGAASVVKKVGVFAFNTLHGIDTLLTGVTTIYKGSAGSGGGGGGGGDNGGSPGRGGGGGGASGGIILGICNLWSGTFTISNVGGAGGNGVTGLEGDGGDGAGGSGGTNIIVYGTKTWSGSHTLTGGAAGNGGGSGTAWTAATAGVTGVSYEIDITTLTR